ncbi:hypothetical protein CLH61_18200 [Marinobacter profundi]|uniref:Teneurin-like YD-shell domain-containing protein n=1 Tax=Marinobacter profundi TaxID=2666256 RepID=A0A2G1UG60_9GAMM|nr:hypothetical protein CLH61_18200 [Marinobacter profundi]
MVADYAYTLDATGRRTQVQEAHNGQTTGYRYDELYRLTGETITDPVNGNHSAEYQFDKVGNRTYSIINGVHTAYSYDNNDRLTQQGGVSYSYDANGNTLTETEDGQVTRYHYDARNNLIEVEKPGLTASYGYNADGIRTRKTENGVITHYVVDSNRDYAQVLAEVTNGTTDVSYTYGDDLLAQHRLGATSYYLYDGHGSTRALADEGGAVTDTYHYNAFGVLLASTGDTENAYRYTGEQRDAGLEQYYLRARYYDQSVGRFTQMDSWMGLSHDPVTLHKYLYANADPVTHIDPTGNFSLGSVMSGINVMGNLAMRAYNAYSFFDSMNSVLNGETEVSASAIGMAIIFNASGGKLLNLLPKKTRERILKVPGRVRTRINLANCVTRNERSNVCEEGWEHVVRKHFSGQSNKSQFSVGEEELRYLLQSQRVVSALPKELAGGNKARYLRTVKLSQYVGTDIKSGGRKTKYLSVITDKYGNILTATPGKINAP